MKVFLKSELLFLCCVIFLAALLRLPFLDRIPTGIGQDEIDYQLTAKSILLSSKDISQSTDLLHILTFNYPQTDSPKAELPYFLALSSLLFAPFSLLSARILFALISIATVIPVYYITKYFFRKEIAYIASILFAINPWGIFIGRTSFEVVPAVFFFLLTFYALLVLQKWKALWAIPLIILAFYSYIATKVITLPFILLIILYLYFVEKRRENKFPYFFLCLFTLCLTLFFLFSISTQATSRASDIFTPFASSVSDEVNEFRKNTISVPTTVFFENKFMVYFRSILVKFVEIVSPQYLFLFGDSFVSLWRHGLFYLLDAIFLVYGIIHLLRKEKKISLLFISLSVVSIIPHLVHKGSGNFTPHIALLFPFTVMIISYGLFYSYSVLPQMTKKLFMGTVIIGYSISLLYFCHIYFFYYPVKSQTFDFPTRVLSKYVALATEKGETIAILSPYPEDTYKKYLFYTASVQRDTLEQIRIAFKSKKYVIGKVSIVGCDDKIQADVTIYNEVCRGRITNQKQIAIADIADSGERYIIVNDTICSSTLLPPYISHVTLRSLNVENFSADTLCSTLLISRM